MTPNSNSARICVQCTYPPKFHHPMFTRSEVIMLTNKQTNRCRWKHPTLFATLLRWVKDNEILWWHCDKCCCENWHVSHGVKPDSCRCVCPVVCVLVCVCRRFEWVKAGQTTHAGISQWWHCPRRVRCSSQVPCLVAFCRFAQRQGNCPLCWGLYLLFVYWYSWFPRVFL